MRSLVTFTVVVIRADLENSRLIRIRGPISEIYVIG